MAAFLNNCRFVPSAGGTTDWVYASAVGGCQSPTLAGAIDGRKYKFIAISSDLTQWEIAEGTYTAASGTFIRAIVLYNSSGSGVSSGQSGAGTRINFAAAPNVAIVAVKEDLISIEEPSAFTAAQMAQARANLGVTKKNYIINGGMMVSQENGSTAISATGTATTYVLDQWFFYASALTGTASIAQVAKATPGGSPNRLRVTVTAAQASIASSYLIVAQRIEGYRCADLLWGSASAKTVTAQIGVNAPAGTYTVAVYNNGAASGASGTFTISAGEAGADVVKTVTLAGVATGTWSTDNTVGMELRVYAAINGQANLLATNGAVMELFDVGLYEGAAAPAFQLPDFASELLTCQRYWEKSYDYGTAPGTATSVGQWQIINQGSALTAIGLQVGFKAPKRATPTITTYSPNNGAAGNAYSGNSSINVAANVPTVGTGSFHVWVALSSVTTANIWLHWKSDARM
ncbi:hypothetical protein G8O24_03115 [Bradyrhizobium sp. INPA01-394B]|uniref:Uncharacterized protein n=1 Tax=Bradyrhizobium campsiandrae TaxID=1729892 RepID=A0ABR7U7X4_9BRAD|nr:hypothetical protein [Bradyrhizobium campsiandrae]MBC9876336.1 hypothetical protein [Bradyrhizobium campsiandrae]MBC9980141.1 hypothetical protein [Bradyrhizobium campsiandrae]